MENAGNTMWNDIVNANCARATVTASRPSNIGTIRPGWIVPPDYHAIGLADIPNERMAGSCEVPLAGRCGRHSNSSSGGSGVRFGLSPSKTQNDPEGGIPSGSLEVAWEV